MARPPRARATSSKKPSGFSKPPSKYGKRAAPVRRNSAPKPESQSGAKPAKSSGPPLKGGRPSSKAHPSRNFSPKKAASTPGGEAAGARPKPPPRGKTDPEIERLHVRIAHSGLCSRRAAEAMIRAGRVEVNGEIVKEMGLKTGPDDIVLVDGQPIYAARHYTVLLNKPTGVVTTLSDPQGRPTIVRHLPELGVQLKPVGRLDMDTDGLLLCTNDGELAQRLAHPRYGIEKEYQAIVSGIPDDKALQALCDGIFVEGRRTAPAKVTIVHAEPRRNTTSLKIIIHEGRKRQIRIMCETVGHPIQSLRRVRIGPLYLKGMRAGECKMLGKKEVDELRALVGLPPS